jgi:hypothetical protein
MFGNWNREVLLKNCSGLVKGVELRSTDSRRRLSPQKERRELVAAGVGLRGHQYQAGARRNRLGLRWMAERAQDAEYCDVGGEDTEANRSDHSEAEDNGHQEGNHGFKILVVMSAEAGHFVSVNSTALWSVVVDR